jgi:hypothetical protein
MKQLLMKQLLMSKLPLFVMYNRLDDLKPFPSKPGERMGPWALQLAQSAFGALQNRRATKRDFKAVSEEYWLICTLWRSL